MERTHMISQAQSFTTTTAGWPIVFSDDFNSYDIGDFSDGYSPVREFHFPPRIRNQGEWQEIASHHLWDPSRNPDFPNWKIIGEDGGKRLKQTLNNMLNRKDWKYPIKKLLFPSRLQLLLTMPALAAGDFRWSDYAVRLEGKALQKDDYYGLMFRSVDGQQHYLFALKDDKAFLMKRQMDRLYELKSVRYRYTCGESLSLSIVAEGDRIRCFVDDRMVMEGKDKAYDRGRMGIASNVPALFTKVEVFMKEETSRTFLAAQSRAEREQKELTRALPSLELWKRIRIPDLCSGRSVRFGDLTGNGTKDLVMAQGTELAADHCAINALTAIDCDGNILWKRGVPTGERKCLPCDLPFQIYDIDGDGKNEVICAINFEIQILDGSTGEIKAKRPTPQSTSPLNKFERILGDCLYFANLRGNARPQEILFKDRYSELYAYDSSLNPLWEYRCNTGHFPFTFDPEDRGEEKILIGYTLLDGAGKKIWSLPLNDHADAVAAFKFPGDNEFTILIAASDEGMIFADMKGHIKKHLRLGHVQTVTIANLMGTPGEFQIATNTFWGNPGNIYILDKRGSLLSSFQPSVYGSPLYPVNWAGNGEKLLLLGAASTLEGGLYDGFGRQAVCFPDDGHPTLCYNAVDFAGDSQDSIVCWDFEELWIYTRSGAKTERAPHRPTIRPSLYNASNYRSNISI